MKAYALIGAAVAAIGAATPANAQADLLFRLAAPILSAGPGLVRSAASGTFNRAPGTAYRVLGYADRAAGPLRYETTPAYFSNGRPVYSNGPSFSGGVRRR